MRMTPIAEEPEQEETEQQNGKEKEEKNGVNGKEKNGVNRKEEGNNITVTIKDKEENLKPTRHQCRIDKTTARKNGLSRKEVAFVSECQDCKRTVKFIQTKGEFELLS